MLISEIFPEKHAAVVKLINNPLYPFWTSRSFAFRVLPVPVTNCKQCKGLAVTAEKHRRYVTFLLSTGIWGRSQWLSTFFDHSSTHQSVQEILQARKMKSHEKLGKSLENNKSAQTHHNFPLLFPLFSRHDLTDLFWPLLRLVTFISKENLFEAPIQNSPHTGRVCAPTDGLSYPHILVPRAESTSKQNFRKA